jgi:hypothetical protein
MSTGIMQHRVFFPTIRRYPKTNVSGQLAWIKDPKLLSQKKKREPKLNLAHSYMHAYVKLRERKIMPCGSFELMFLVPVTARAKCYST